jgi:hypothetical protein
MAAYNDNTPCTIGTEWMPTIEGVDRLAGDHQVAGALLTSTVTETVESVHVGLTGNAGEDSGWELEIYEADDLPGTDLGIAIYRPACDAENVDAYGWDGSVLSQSNLWDTINDLTLTPDTYLGRAVADNDWVAPIFGAGAEYSFRVDGIDGTLDGKNITRVRLRAKVSEIVVEALVEGATFTPYLEHDGRRAFGEPRTFSGEPGLGDAWGLTHDWWANPFTGGSWKPADVDGFDCDNDDYSAGWIIKATGTSNNTAVVMQGYLQIEYLDETDKRVAVGTLTEPDGQVGWHSFDLFEPDGSAGWSKVNGTEYLFVFRRRVGTGYADWRYLVDQEHGNPDTPAWSRVTPTLYPSTLTVKEAGDTQPGMHAIILELAASAVSADSQPYLSINDDGGPGARFQHDWTKVNTSQGVIQEFTTAGAASYGAIRFVASWESQRPAHPLLVRIKRRSTSAQQGSVLTIDPLDLTPSRARMQVVEAYIPGGPIALLATTQYFVEFSSAAPAGQGWRVQVLSTLVDTEPGGPPVAAYGRTRGGTTDVAQIGGAEYPSLDVAVTVATLSPAPTNVAALIVSSGCFDEAQITWTATDVTAAGCGDFLAYEIERTSDGGATWERIGSIDDEDATEFVDVEGPRGVNTQYRVRTRRDDQSFSLWGTSNGVTRSVSCCGYILASNEARDWSLFVTDIGPQRSWEFPDRRRFHFLAGRDYGVGFGEIEQRGAHFTFEGLVAALGAEGGVIELVEGGIQNFDALRWLLADAKDPDVGTKLALSYVAVCDEKGNRWLADVSILDARADGENGQHIATIRVRPVRDTPSVVTDGGSVGS